MTIAPAKNQEDLKKQQIANMFNNISPKYDFLNHFLSLGIDVKWRKKAIKMLEKDAPKHILDVATGTGDFAMEALKLHPEHVTGIDISEGMLDVGRRKIEKKNLSKIINLEFGDSENMNFSNNKFDAVIVAFGVRNFEFLDKGLTEIHRVLKKGGKMVVLEFSKPIIFPVKQLYHFYFNHVLPKIGKIVSKNHLAYTYLPKSVREFPFGNDFLSIMKKNGFKNCQCVPLTLGIASIYIGEK